MALSLALPLSGLEPDYFGALGARLLYEQGLRTLNRVSPEQMSPRSFTSESSGVGSLGPSIEICPTSEGTPLSSRPNTPQNILRTEEKPKEQVRVLYENRDILNLGANIREPCWQLKIPTMPRYNFTVFMANRSLYYRLGEYGLREEYPMRTCQDCGFKEPSPLIL